MRVPSLAERIDWEPLLADVANIVHLAGVAHKGAAVSDEMYDRINHVAVADLAAAAAKSGVARIVFTSSIGSQSGSSCEHVLSEADEPRPTTAYGRSKLAAEIALRASGVLTRYFAGARVRPECAGEHGRARPARRLTMAAAIRRLDGVDARCSRSTT